MTIDGEIQYIFTGGKNGIKNTSKLFFKTVDLYRNNRNRFDELLMDAKVFATCEMATKEDAFNAWVIQSKYSYNRDAIELAFRVMTILAYDNGLIKNSFYEVSDVKNLEIIRQQIEKKKIGKIGCDVDCFFRAYSDYLKEKHVKRGSEIVTDKSCKNEVKAKVFFGWLIDSMKLATATARGYSSAINTATPYAQEICGIVGSIYDIDDLDELQAVLTKMMSDERFIAVNEQSHNRFRGAFDKYLQYKNNQVGDVSYTSILKSSDEDASFDDVEKIVKEADIDGITASNISARIGKSIWLVNKHLKTQSYAIEIPGEIYIHVDNVIDIYENKPAIRKILENQFGKFRGYTNDVVLMDAATITLGMFLNDNCIDTPEKMYGIARFLFEKEEKLFYFAGDKHIWSEQPQYSANYAGVVMGYISSNGGRATKLQCIDYLQKVKLSSNNINGILSMATCKDVLFYGNEEYVMADSVIEDEEWMNRFKSQIAKLFIQSSYVILREISDNWFELLPNLYGGMVWNLSLLQDLIKKYLPEYRLIMANENQGLETIRAGIVYEDSMIGNFADLVYARLLEDSDIELPLRIEKEAFRHKLIEYGMIQGNELIYTMPKAVYGAKFAWASDGESVLVLNN